MDNFFLNPARLSAIGGQALARLSALRAGDYQAFQNDFDAADNVDSGGYEIHNGVAVIEIRGSLASRQLGDGCYYAEMTYEGIISQVEHAVGNPAVSKILLSVNSPGGTVTGCAEAAARLDALSDKKPVWAHCTMADSAAYWLASATNRIIVDPTGEVGSIGVIMTHIDISKLLEEFGVSIKHIHAGARKADGSPFVPLSEDAEKRFQADVDHLRDIFVTTVSAFRQIDADDVRATEAMTYIGAKAVAADLADATGFFSDVLKEMAGGSPIRLQPKPHEKENSMRKKTRAQNEEEKKKAKKPSAKKSEEDERKDDPEADDEPEQDEDDQATSDPADDDKKDGQDDRAEDDQDEDDKDAEDEEDDKDSSPTASAERQRIRGIMGHREAKGRETLAKSLALNTSLSVKAAAKVLADAPQESASSGGLGAAMRKAGNANIGPAPTDKSAGGSLVSDMKQRFSKAK